MSSETESQAGAAFLAGVQRRQAWAPAALRLTTSLVAGIRHRAESLGVGAGRLARWHEEPTPPHRRVDAWSPLELPAPVVEPRQVAGHQPPDGVRAGRRTAPATASAPGAPAADPSPAPLRRARARLRPVFAAEETTTPEPARAQAGERPVWQPLELTRIRTPEPHLVPTVSSEPRREVRQPLIEPRQARPGEAAAPISRRLPALPEEPRLPRAAEKEAPAATPPAMAPVRREPAASPPPATPDAIAELIEKTVSPVSLPGIELRPVTPAAETEAAPAPAKREPRAPTAPPAPPLDINAVSDKVYEMLQRRQRLERERRGSF
ncbi:MAG: hypothetical protein GY719_00835 [bacterium]|nr:hypothetical protein [bacterium]